MPPPIPGLLQPAQPETWMGNLQSRLNAQPNIDPNMPVASGTNVPVSQSALLQAIHDRRPDLSDQDIRQILAEFAMEQRQPAAPQASQGFPGGLEALRSILSGQGGQAGYNTMGQPTGLNNAFPGLQPNVQQPFLRQPTVQQPMNGPQQPQPLTIPGLSMQGQMGGNLTGKPNLMQQMPSLNYQFPPIRF